MDTFRGSWVGYWKKHTKDHEATLELFHRNGWIIEDPPKYYTLKCPCGDHMRWYHLTPSGANYARNAASWGKRQPCWKGNP